MINKSWNEISVDNSLVIVGIAPIEEHGKHLPICVDYYMTNKLIESVRVKLGKENDIEIYTLPTIPLGVSDVKGFTGCLYIGQKQMYSMVKDILQSVCSWGVKNIVVISAHADPKHLLAIEQACEHINNRHGVCAISPMGAIFSSDEMGIKLKYSDQVKTMLEQYPDDYHAGWIETSMMLYYDSDNVKDEYKQAEDIIISEKQMIFPKVVNEKIAGVGHLGYPRLADIKLGENLHSSMVDIICEAIGCFINRDGYEKYMHHFLYKIPFLRAKPFRR